VTIDPERLPELLMAYADGELDPLMTRRIAGLVADDPALAAQVARHRALREHVHQAFAPVADEPLPDRLTALLQSNVHTLVPPPAKRDRGSTWMPRAGIAAAMAACLMLGVAVGTSVDRGPVRIENGGLFAGGRLATALEQVPSGGSGPVRVALSFRDADRRYCRVFGTTGLDGIACRDGDGWRLRQARSVGVVPATSPAYAQAGSADPTLMAAAQDMMAGAPLDAPAEAAARRAGWR
jgi:hypothetical protein